MIDLGYIPGLCSSDLDLTVIFFTHFEFEVLILKIISQNKAIIFYLHVCKMTSKQRWAHNLHDVEYLITLHVDN